MEASFIHLEMRVVKEEKKCKRVVVDSAVWRGKEHRFARKFPGFAPSSFWLQWYKNKNVAHLKTDITTVTLGG